MTSPRASRSLLVTQTAASRVHTIDTHHTNAYPPDNRPTLAPSLTTTFIYTLGANAHAVLLSAMANGSTVCVLVIGGEPNLKDALSSTH